MRSRELVSAVALMAGVVVLGVVAKGFVGSWREVFEGSLAAAAVREDRGEMQWAMAVRRMMWPVLLPVGMVMGASFAGALGAGVAQGGGLRMVPGAVGFKLSRLSPAANLKNLLSLRAATRVAKSLVPAAAMVVLGWVAVKGLMVAMPVMSLARLPVAFRTAYRLALDAAWVTLAWSGVDYAVEWVSWKRRMRMTKQQVKDEAKETTGNPQVKARIKQVQNAIRLRSLEPLPGRRALLDGGADGVTPGVGAVRLRGNLGRPGVRE